MNSKLQESAYLYISQSLGIKIEKLYYTEVEQRKDNIVFSPSLSNSSTVHV
jgi:hypothetical protein